MKAELRTDRRACTVESAPEAERIVRSSARRLAGLEADIAKAMCEVERTRSYLRHGQRSVEAWGEAQGYGPRRVRQLLELGRALADSPALERGVRAGTVTGESAAHVGRVLRDEKTGADEAKWVELAENLPPRELARAAVMAIEEARQRELLVPLRLCVTRTARDNFQRARRLISKGRRQLVTEGEAFAHVMDDFLARKDPRLRKLPPAGVTQGRTISSRVRAEVERRSGGICEICGERRAQEKMHLQVPHAQGGTREVDNLADACLQCHKLADAGYYTFARFDPDGSPVWDAHPERLRERAPPFFSSALW